MDRRLSLELRGYIIAVLSVALAVLIRRLLDPLLGEQLPFVMLYCALAVAVWFGGYRPAMVASVLGFFACDYLFIPPRGVLFAAQNPDLVGGLRYVISCAVIIGLGEATRIAWRRVHEQSESLRITMASMGDAVITTDANGRVISLNPVAVALTGWAENDGVGQPLGAVFHIVNEQTRENVENPALRALKEGKITGLANHTILIARDGSERCIDDSAAPIRDGKGKTSGVVLIFRDVTERRHAEKSAQLLASIVESSDDAIIAKDTNGIITSWNRAAERIFGFSAKEAVGNPIAMLAPADRADEMPAILERIKRGEKVDHFDTVRKAKDGRLVPISLTVSPIRNEYGEIIGASKIARDISERKQAEAALQEERNRLHATLTGIGDGVVVTDAEGRVTLMNPVAETLTGWKGEANGRPLVEVFRIVNEETRKRVENPVTRVLREGTVVGLANHTVLIAKDGNEKPIEDSAAPVRGVTGGVIGVVLVFRDASERRAAEDAVRAVKQELEIVTTSMSAPVTRCSRDLRYQWVSKSYADWQGRPAEEIVNRPIVEVIGQKAFDEIRPHFDQVLSGQIVRFEEQVDYQPIGSRWVSAVYTPVFDSSGVVDGWVAAVIDISERKRMEEALRHSEEAQRFLAEASCALAAVEDYESTLQKVAQLSVPYFADWCTVDMADNGFLNKVAVAHVNPEKLELAGEFQRRYPPRPDDAHGPAHVFRIGEPELVPEISAEMIAQSARDEEQLRMLRELGFKSYLAVPIRIGGKPIGVLTFIIAESSRRFGQADLRLAEDLAGRAGVAIENARLYAELKEADRRKNEFLATLAHELRNPLAPIRNGLELIRVARNGGSEIESIRAMMERQLAQLVRLVDDLLDVSRITRGKVELHCERIDLAHVLQHAIETSRPLLDAEQHQLALKLPPEQVFVHADFVRLAQVFSNLLNNAAKFTPEGGQIDVKAEREGNEAVIVVEDNGVGIAPEQFPKLFEMFSQLRPALERTQGGLGIGLTLSKGLVEMHRGRIEARSSGPGNGSEFIVRLPVDTTAQPVAPSPTQEAAPAEAKYRILLVDDNRDTANTMAKLMGFLGHEVQTAHDGEEAVAAAESFQPDVVLLDIGLPKINGYEAARRIRAQPWGQNMTLIALTGWGQDQDRRRSKEAGFDHHLVKPIRMATIEKLLAEVAPK